MMHEPEESDSGIVARQCRMRHCLAHADRRTMPNGLGFPRFYGELVVIGSA